MSDNQPLIVVLNEATAARALWSAFRNRTVRIAAVEPYLPPLGGILERAARFIAGRMERMGRPPGAAETALRRDIHIPLREGIYLKVEPWQTACYDYAGAEAKFGSYDHSYRKTVNAFHHRRYLAVYLIDAFLGEFGPCHLAGVDADLAALYRQTFDRPLPGAPARPHPLRAFFNTATALLMLGAGAAMILRRIRLRVSPKRYFLGVDWMGDWRDEQLFTAVEGDGLAVLRVPRYSDLLRVHGRLLRPDMPIATPGDGLLPLGAGIGSLGEAMVDIFRLAVGTLGFQPRLFYELAALPVRRMLIRALLHRFPCAFYWGRDEYNVEHILRSEELRRQGGVSLGIFHGLPLSAQPWPYIRFVDFDICYIFGAAIGAIYKDTWPAHMRVHPIGGFGFSTGEYPPPVRNPSRDILVFINPTIPVDLWVRTVGVLREAFPDRKMILKYKDSSLDRDDIAQLRATLHALHPGLTEHTGSAYAAMAIGGYAVSDPSSVVAECLQYGLPTFLIDYENQWRSLIYRGFPDLCYADPADIAARIRDLESGRATFDRNIYRTLVAMPDTHWVHAVRKDMASAPAADTARNAA